MSLNPVTLTISNTINKFRDISFSERLNYVNLIIQYIKQTLSNVELEVLIEKNKLDHILISSMISHGVDPSKHLGMAEILDYITDKYRDFDEFCKNESLLITILKERDFYSDMIVSLNEAWETEINLLTT